jgi:hypothetical protein
MLCKCHVKRQYVFVFRFTIFSCLIVSSVLAPNSHSSAGSVSIVTPINWLIFSTQLLQSDPSAVAAIRKVHRVEFAWINVYRLRSSDKIFFQQLWRAVNDLTMHRRYTAHQFLKRFSGKIYETASKSCDCRNDLFCAGQFSAGWWSEWQVSLKAVGYQFEYQVFHTKESCLHLVQSPSYVCQPLFYSPSAVCTVCKHCLNALWWMCNNCTAFTTEVPHWPI